MGDINIDELQAEINAAENYLRTVPQSTASLRQSFPPSSTAEQRATILQQMGAGPTSSSVEVSSGARSGGVIHSNSNNRDRGSNSNRDSIGSGNFPAEASTINSGSSGGQRYVEPYAEYSQTINQTNEYTYEDSHSNAHSNAAGGRGMRMASEDSGSTEPVGGPQHHQSQSQSQSSTGPSSPDSMDIDNDTDRDRVIQSFPAYQNQNDDSHNRSGSHGYSYSHPAQPQSQQQQYQRQYSGAGASPSRGNGGGAQRSPNHKSPKTKAIAVSSASPSPASKYNSQGERDKLVERLLSEHAQGSKKKGKGNSSSAGANANTGRGVKRNNGPISGPTQTQRSPQQQHFHPGSDNAGGISDSPSRETLTYGVNSRDRYSDAEEGMGDRDTNTNTTESALADTLFFASDHAVGLDGEEEGGEEYMRRGEYADAHDGMGLLHASTLGGREEDSTSRYGHAQGSPMAARTEGADEVMFLEGAEGDNNSPSTVEGEYVSQYGEETYEASTLNQQNNTGSYGAVDSMAQTLDRNVRSGGADRYDQHNTNNNDNNNNYANNSKNLNYHDQDQNKGRTLRSAWETEEENGISTADAAAGGGALTERERLRRARAASGPPSRLMHRQAKDWKFIKSRDACLKEGEKDVREKFTFKPTLSAKVRRESEVASSSSHSHSHTSRGAVSNTFSAQHRDRDSRSRSPGQQQDRANVRDREYLTKGNSANVRDREYLTKGNSANKPTRASVDSSRHSSGSQRIDQTILQREEKFKQRERVRQQAEVLELSACTFQPKISKNANRIVKNKHNKQNMNRIRDQRSNNQGGGGWGVDSSVESLNPFEEEIIRSSENNLQQVSHHGNVHSHAQPKVTAAEGMHASNRLYNDHQIRKDQQRDLRQRVGEERSNQYTFQPSINPNTRAMFEEQEEMGVDRVPLHERVADLQRYKSQKLQTLRQAVEESEGRTLTFAPEISQASRNMAARQRQGEAGARAYDAGGDVEELGARPEIASNKYAVSVSDRLLEEGRHSTLRKQRMLMAQEAQQAIENAQGPVSKGTSALASTSNFVGASFAQRQYMHLQRVNANREARVREEAAQSEGWYNPDIGRSEEIIAQCKPIRIIETVKERTQRMHSSDKMARDLKLAKKTEEVYADVTFQPKLDRVSAALGQKSTVGELVNNPRGQAVREAVRARVEAERAKEETFRPTLPTYIPEGFSIHDITLPASGDTDENVRDRSLALAARESQLVTIDNNVNNVNVNMSGNSTSRAAHGLGLGGVPGGYSTYNTLYVTVRYHSWDEEGAISASAREALDESAAREGVVGAVAAKMTINMKEPEQMARDIRRRIIEKEERRRSELLSRELHELQECTFQPQLSTGTGSRGEHYSFSHNRSVHKSMNSSFADANGVQVKGVDRHLELKVMSLKQKEEKFAREREVFGSRDPVQRGWARVEDGSTVIKPFRLSEPDTRPSRVVEELRLQDEHELTFEPSTENAYRRQNLRAQARAVF